jgi:hypothetical protein
MKLNSLVRVILSGTVTLVKHQMNLRPHGTAGNLMQIIYYLVRTSHVHVRTRLHNYCVCWQLNCQFQPKFARLQKLRRMTPERRIMTVMSSLSVGNRISSPLAVVRHGFYHHRLTDLNRIFVSSMMIIQSANT